MDLHELIEKVIGGGVFNFSDSTHFSWGGCEYPKCKEYGKGAEVFDVQGFLDIDEARKDQDDYYEFQLCKDCFVSLYLGEEVEERVA